MLNCLFGIFGRNKDLHSCINVKASDLHKYMATYFLTNMIDIGNDMYTLIIQNNLNTDVLKDLKSYISTDHEFVYDQKAVKLMWL